MKTLVATVIAIALVATGCGDSGGSPATTEDRRPEPPPTATSNAPAPTGGTAAPPATAPPATAPPGTTVPTTPETSGGTDPALQNCDTNIGADVPLFYRAYFRCVDIRLDGDAVVISSSNLPPHLSYYYGEASALFAIFDTSRGNQYRANPNLIAETPFTIRIPLRPVSAGVTINRNAVNGDVGDPSDYGMGVVGVALDSVALFNPLANPPDQIEDERFTFDSNEGHPQMQGAYHYHAGAPGPLRVLASLGFVTSAVWGEAEIELYGVMCDGTVVMGMTELDGSAAATDVDAQAGHTHDIVDGGGTVVLENPYHVHLAQEIGPDPRGLTPEAQYYTTCDVTGGA